MDEETQIHIPMTGLLVLDVSKNEFGDGMMRHLFGYLKGDKWLMGLVFAPAVGVVRLLDLTRALPVARVLPRGAEHSREPHLGFVPSLFFEAISR